MSTEERDESQPRPRKVIPSIRRENTDQDSERRPYNQGYNRPEGNNYERRPYNRGGYNSYGDNRSYGDRPSRPRTYDNRDGGYNKPYNRDNGGNRSYGNSNREGGYNSRPSYGSNRPYGNNDRPSYGNDRSYGNERPYNRPSRPNYEVRLMIIAIIVVADLHTVITTTVMEMAADVAATITTDVRTTIAVPVITIRMPSITSRSS